MAGESLVRRLAAILVADVVGYSRLMETDEAGTLRAVMQHRRNVIDPAIAAHNGRLVKLMGDGILVEFASAVDAVNCATDIQRQTLESHVNTGPDCRVELRIGINLGDVIVEGDDIYGDGVNVAARLEGLAEPGGICLSGSVYDATGSKLAMQCEYLGEQKVKNLSKPVRSYRVLWNGPTSRPAPSPAAARPVDTTKTASEPTLAVKPFESRGGDAESVEFADTLSSGLIVALTRLPGLILVQDESRSLQDSKRMSLQELGKRFDVHCLLKGQVHKLGARLRVNTELLEVATGRILWADKLDRELRDLGDFFAIQDEITDEIVTSLDIKLVAGEGARIARNVLKDPTALEHLYNGERLLWKATNKLELQEAQRLLEEVARLEPEASIGYAEAALAHWAAAFFGLSADLVQSLDKAAELARQAIALDDVTGYPHMILAQVHLYRRQFDEAEAEADQAVSARPSCPASFAIRANVLNHLGDSPGAVESAQHAFRLSPIHPQIFPAVLANAYYGAGRYEEAMAAAKGAIELEPTKIEPHLIHAASAVALGMIGEAQQVAQQVLAMEPDFSLSDFASSQPYKVQAQLDGLIEQLRTAGLQ